MRIDVGTLLQALPDAAIVAGPDGVVRAANDWAATRLGRPVGDLVGRTLSDVLDGSGTAGLAATFDRMDDDAPEHVAVVSSGGAVVRWRIAALRESSGSRAGTVAVVDGADEIGVVTQRCDAIAAELTRTHREAMTASAELQAANEELETLNEELRERLQQLDEAQRMDARKNEFLAMLAHELRNPLAPLVSALHIVREHVPDDPTVRHAVQVASRQVRHQTRLLDDLLDVSRLAAGKIALVRSPVNLTDIVGQAIEALDLSIRSHAHQLVLDRPSVPLLVDGDATRLEQVVWNLLSNAVKYTKPGGRIGITLREDRDCAALTVTDTGVGIAPEVLPRIFDLFVQGQASLARSQGGLGIGLTLVRQLVELHRGTVTASSEGPGRGSTFEVRLPRSDQTRRPTSGARGPTAGPPRALRIALVEDNRDAREMLRMVLELQGHQVFGASDGAAGIQLIVTTTPDVALVDIGLPGVDGYGVARRVRHRLGAQVRLIALTGYGDADSRRMTHAAGFDTHLVKPVDPEDLARLLATLP